MNSKILEEKHWDSLQNTSADAWQKWNVKNESPS